MNLEGADVDVMKTLFLAPLKLDDGKDRKASNALLFLLRCNSKAATPKGFNSEAVKLELSSSALEFFKKSGRGLLRKPFMPGVAGALLELEPKISGKPPRCLLLCGWVGLPAEAKLV